MAGKGQPRAFKTAEELINTFYNYIDKCIERQYLPNIAGFCVFAHINRDTFYMQKEYYPDTYKRIEDTLEDEAINTKGINDTLKIFYLKNKFNYKDKTEQDLNAKLEINMSDEVKELAQ